MATVKVNLTEIYSVSLTASGLDTLTFMCWAYLYLLGTVAINNDMPLKCH